MADGDLDTEITEDLGMYESDEGGAFPGCANGFKKAVDEEVKSQRMKNGPHHERFP